MKRYYFAKKTYLCKNGKRSKPEKGERTGYRNRARYVFGCHRRANTANSVECIWPRDDPRGRKMLRSRICLKKKK